MHYWNCDHFVACRYPRSTWNLSISPGHDRMLVSKKWKQHYFNWYMLFLVCNLLFIDWFLVRSWTVFSDVQNCLVLDRLFNLMVILVTIYALACFLLFLSIVCLCFLWRYVSARRTVSQAKKAFCSHRANSDFVVKNKSKIRNIYHV